MARRDAHATPAAGNRRWPHHNVVAIANRAARLPLSKRARLHERNLRLPYVPPEDWHEPAEDGRTYRFVVQPAGEGYRHIVTPDEVRQRLASLPARFREGLEVVQLSRMTRKKLSFPCYGMQWGATVYLYPIEASLIECYDKPPKPLQAIEARMFGGRWEENGLGEWKLVWTLPALKDFYLNNILIHELGHLVDNRNSSPADRERFAEWFALEYGYKPTRRKSASGRPVRRHHVKR